MRRAWLALFIFIFAPPAATQTAPAGDSRDTRRFTFTPADGGFMRLDTKTGNISMCARNGASFVCRAVQDDRQAMDGEIERLARENVSLKARMADLEKRQQSPLPQFATAPRSLLPGAGEIDRAFNGIEKLARGFLDVMRQPLLKPERT